MERYYQNLKCSVCGIDNGLFYMGCCINCWLNWEKRLGASNNALRARNAELEAENGRLRDLLNESRKGLINLCDYNIIPERYREEALFRANEIYKALSQSGDRWEKMQAVIRLAKEAHKRYVDFTAATEPGSEAWRYNYLDDAMANLKEALADLEGGGE